MTATPHPILTAGDEPRLERYLASRPDTTLFLRGNLHTAGGLGVEPTRPFAGVHAAAFDGDEIVGVVAHYWNGNAVLEADDDPGGLVIAAMRASGKPLKALIGPATQVAAARAALSLEDAPAKLDSVEHLYGLDLAHLQVPDVLAQGTVTCRRAETRDLDRLTEMTTAYLIETIGEPDNDTTRASGREGTERSLRTARAFVLEHDGTLVSKSAFNSAVPECVQIGGVFTPPALRGKGYGRAVVAGSLQIAAREGVGRSVLFTDHANIPAQRAYEALGYERIGEYAILLFRDGQSVD